MTRPNVLILSGHDPSGGAGLQADIEAVGAQDGHGVSVITALTRQDTQNVYDVHPVDNRFFADCIDTVIADMPIAAVKTGVIASPGQVDTIAGLMTRYPGLPLVVDPVLSAAGGGELAADSVGRALRDRLLGHASLITPNAGEARRLCDGEPDIDRCGARLAGYGPQVLITGGDEDDAKVINRRYTPNGDRQLDRWPRLDGRFHGSGCTLASSIAARLANDQSLAEAIAEAQQFTWHALENAFNAGQGQAIPDRRASSRAPK